MYRRTYYDRDPDRYTSYPRRPYSSYDDRYRYSTFNPLYYGTSRRDGYYYPWERDYLWRRRRDERTEEIGDERSDETREVRTEDRRVNTRELRDPETDEEVNKRFHLKKIDLNIKENTRNHHTDKYICTKKKDNPELVIRRGQGFVMTITFDREYKDDQNQITFTFKTGKNPMPPKRTAAKVVMDEEAKSKGKKTEWFVKMIGKKNKSIDVEITPPCNCIIGEWMFDILTESKLKEDGDTLTLDYQHNEDIIILLNPWCQDDQVYMSTENLLNEYILNESGAIFSGNYHQRAVKPWNFGQFHEGILSICLHVIRKAFNNTVDPGMGDVIKLSRAISKIVNAQGDSGVLVGKWDGDYSGGSSPTKWIGSVAILEEYEKNQGQGVKFGQCWVFSGLVTTLCRAIGLPARSVTNFASAHDTDGTTSIDKVFTRDPNGDLERLNWSSDSTWNFHVWNEAWMSRPDLGKGFDGWQVIDATPQETSEGEYRCGPAPVSAIKKGEIGKEYDAPFIFAEVNADIVHWEVIGNGDWVVIETDTNDVGKNISTKIPDGKPCGEEVSIWRGYGEKYRLDITNAYKYPEGTLEERLAVQNANKIAKVDRDVMATVEKQDISLEIVEKDGVMIGSDFEIEVKVKNIKKKRARRTVKHLQVIVDSLKYTGDGRKNIIKKAFDDIVLDFEDEKIVKVPVKTEEYFNKMYELFNMEITAFAHVKETENYYMKRDDYRLRRPDIDIKAPERVKVGSSFEVKLSFKNTLPVPLTKCSLLIEGNGIKNFTKSQSDVSAKSDWASTENLVAETDGDIQINVSFDCEELRDIVGIATVMSEE